VSANRSLGARLVLLFVLPAGATSQIEPGVLDVQAWDWLQQDLEKMIDRTKAHARDRLSPEAFEAKYVGSTVEYLEIDTATARTLQRAVNKALAEIDGARVNMQRRKDELAPHPNETDAMRASRDAWHAYGKAQRHAVRHPLAVLEPQPRQQLLRENMLRWLLRLDYGMGAAAR
jgi:hypothetical protein